MSSPRSSPRPESGDLVPSAGGDGDGLPVPQSGGGGETMQGEPLPEGQASPATRAKRTPTEPFVDEVAQEATVTTMVEGKFHGPAIDVAGETEVPAR